VDYVHDRISFGYHHARSTRTAAQGHEERVGVCRDFAHLAVALCRAMNIPARYCTGYLGDIGVPPVDAAMDFSAWFEAYLEGGWHTFDARHNVPRIGRIVIARGRDAADVAITHTFGTAWLTHFKVITDEVVAPAHQAHLLAAE
jgi:transglutaminase-like putative cysteine protease